MAYSLFETDPIPRTSGFWQRMKSIVPHIQSPSDATDDGLQTRDPAAMDARERQHFLAQRIAETGLGQHSR